LLPGGLKNSRQLATEELPVAMPIDEKNPVAWISLAGKKKRGYRPAGEEGA